MDPSVLVPPVSAAAVARLREALGVAEPTAQILARRGLTDPGEAAAWLAADVVHPREAFGGLAEAAAHVLAHVERGTPIVVHGDYDCDGVCATAILVRGLRALGADCSFVIPDRRVEGYGLAPGTVRALAERGAGLIVTVDCAVTAVEEVALAHELGVDVVVTDHHRPRADGALPDAPIVHPGLGGYPCPELCGAGVAHKLVEALLQAAGRDPAEAEVDLDLVALATVADCVPLRDENRRLVREGVLAIADTFRPGLRALLEVSRTPPEEVDATAIAFRLAPRINAAGRLHRADPAVELLLTPDADVARRLADRLDHANHERRQVEQRILREAEAAVAAAGDRAGYVLAGEGWHPGVVGIVASRIVEATGRPTVLVALDGAQGLGTGSGRSIPGYDLLAGLDACAAHLLRHGGHRAAAGCTVAADAVPALADAFAAHAEAALAEAAAAPPVVVDAVLGGAELGLPQVEELARLAPFGEGNPEPRLLVPVARAEDVRTMGEGRHLRLALRSGPVRCDAVAFGRRELPVADGEPMAVVGTLEAHRWGGVARPRMRVAHVVPAGPGDAPLRRLDGDAGDVALAVGGARDVLPAAPAGAPGPGTAQASDDLAAGGPAAALVRLLGTGVAVTVVAADAARAAAAMGPVVGGAALTDWWSLARAPGAVDGSGALLLLDPPTDASHAAALDAVRRDGEVAVVRAYGGPEVPLALDVLEQEHELRPALQGLFRELRDRGPRDLGALATACGLPGWRLGLLLRVLAEVGVVRIDDVARTATVVAGVRGSLEDAPTLASWARRTEERRAWLSRTTTTAAPAPRPASSPALTAAA